jgi:site-specific DNA-methyltransferase (adenine-specific)
MSDLRSQVATNGEAPPDEPFSRGLVRIGDCTELMPKFPGEASVDLLLTDPPYFIGASLGTNDSIGVGRFDYAGGYVAHERWLFRCKPTLKRTANVVIFEYPYNLELVTSACRRMGLVVQTVGIWMPPARFNVKRRRPMNGYDVWVWATMHPTDYYYDECGLSDAYYMAQHAIDKSGPIPGQKPIELLRPMIRAMCPANGLVFDPFLGSGSTGRAARMEGRAWGGVEFGERNLATIRGKALTDVPLLEKWGENEATESRD